MPPDAARNGTTTRTRTSPAAYAFGLATAHPFNDGNKRIAVLTAAAFPGLNGMELDVTEPEIVQVITALAAGSLKEPQLAAWVRDHIVRHRP